MLPRTLSNIFGEMDLNMPISADAENAKRTKQSSETIDGVNAETFDDMDALISFIEETGDYKMLPLTMHFMHDLTPFDLYSFFDKFFEVERHIFHDHDIKYGPIFSIYQSLYNCISDGHYIKFVIEYYKRSRQLVDDEFINLEESQRDFLSQRFAAIKYLLIEIGKKVNPDYFDDIIVADTNS